MTTDIADRTLRIGVAQGLSDGREFGASYVGQIIDLTPGREIRLHRRNLIIPVGADASHYLSVDLPPGTYLVEAASPGGELFDTQIVLGEADPQEMVVSLGQSRKIDSELGWQVVAGNLDGRAIAAEQALAPWPAEIFDADPSPDWFSRFLLAMAIGAAIAALLSFGSGYLGGQALPSAPPAERSIAEVSAPSVEAVDTSAVSSEAENTARASDVAAEAASEAAVAGVSEDYGEAVASADSYAYSTDAKTTAFPADRALRGYVEERGAPIIAPNTDAAASSGERLRRNTRAAVTPGVAPSLTPAPSTETAPVERGLASADSPVTDAANSTSEIDSEAPVAAPPPPEPQLAERSLASGWPTYLQIAGVGFALLSLIAGVSQFFRSRSMPAEEAASAGSDPAPASGAVSTASDLPGPGGSYQTEAAAPRAPAALIRFAPEGDSWQAVVNSFGKSCEDIREQWTVEPLPASDVKGFEIVRVSGAPGLDEYARSALLVSPAGSASELIMMPLPWHSARVGNTEVEVVISGNPSSQFRTGTTVRDEEMTSLMGYLSMGRLREAGILVQDRAEELLDQKRSNPFAAALGAYVLLGTAESNHGEPWRPWIANLYALYPTLPDGAVLQAANLLQQGREEDFEQAGHLLVEATKRGIPVFSEGIRLLQSSFALWGSEEGPMLPDMAHASEMVDKVALRCDPKQAITTIRLV